jgi:tRNA_anti-like
MKALMKALLICMFIVIAFCIFFAIQSTDSANKSANIINAGEPPSEVTPASNVPVPLKVSAIQLYVDYKRNEVAADNVYKGRSLAVQGVVASINKDFRDKIYIQLAALSKFESVQAHLDEGNESNAAALQRGQSVSLLCTGGGMIIGSPMLEKCSFASARDNSENVPPTSQQNAEVEENAVSNVSMDSGNNIYKNERYGFSIQRPQSFIAQGEPENGDGLEFKSKDGQASLTVYGMNNAMSETASQRYQEAIKDAHGTVGYTKLADTWFVVTWQDGETISYEKMFVGPASYNAFTFTFPKTQQQEYTDTVTTLAKSFRPGDLSQAQ